jgi:hypothetical protein
VSVPVLERRPAAPSAAHPGIRGREAETAVLDDAIDRAAADRLAVVLIDGEAGIGKTRLLQDALEKARRRGLRVAAARTAELERTRPFGLVAGMFGCTRSAPDPRRAAIGELLARGDRGARGDFEGRGPVTVTSDPGLQFRAVDAFADLAEELALDGPLAGSGLVLELPAIGADLVRLAQAAGEAARARQVADAEVAARNDLAWMTGEALRCRGLARHGQAERARPLLDRVAGGYERLGAGRGPAGTASPRPSIRSRAWSPGAFPIRRSASACTSPAAPCRRTSRTSSPSWTFPRAPSSQPR